MDLISLYYFSELAKDLHITRTAKWSSPLRVTAKSREPSSTNGSRRAVTASVIRISTLGYRAPTLSPGPTSPAPIPRLGPQSASSGWPPALSLK